MQVSQVANVSNRYKKQVLQQFPCKAGNHIGGGVFCEVREEQFKNAKKSF